MTWYVFNSNALILVYWEQYVVWMLSVRCLITPQAVIVVIISSATLIFDVPNAVSFLENDFYQQRIENLNDWYFSEYFSYCFDRFRKYHPSLPTVTLRRFQFLRWLQCFCGHVRKLWLPRKLVQPFVQTRMSMQCGLSFRPSMYWVEMCWSMPWVVWWKCWMPSYTSFTHL